MRLNKILLTVVATVTAWLAIPTANAQDVALKTNLINDIALSPNIGVEVGLAPKWTLDMTAEMNLWKVDGRSWQHLYWAASTTSASSTCRSTCLART